MPKRRKFSGEQICKLLEENGFLFVRQRGSHRIMQMATQTDTITVPVPIHKDLKPGTLASIIRQSQLDRSLFSVTAAPWAHPRRERSPGPITILEGDAPSAPSRHPHFPLTEPRGTRRSFSISAQTPSVPLLRERPTPSRLHGRDDHAPLGHRCAAEKWVMQDDDHLQCAGAPGSPKCLRNSATRLKVCSREAFILSVKSW
jgi:predicted RNA binding protein YcfA (HicA-like mRNA interferase family)